MLETIQVRMVSAEPGLLMQQIIDSGVTVLNAIHDDEDISVTFTVRRADYGTVRKLADRKGYDLQILRRNGNWFTRGRWIRRPVLLAGIAMLLVLAIYLPSRIFFVRIEGNLNIPTRLILEKCSESGISFGASRKDVRSQKMKDALLEAIPELQWAGINTNGCVATITVRERIEKPAPEDHEGLSNIVALRDGIIIEITVTQGNGVCHVGQVVRKGDLLVSGFTDCGIFIKAGRAEAEVFAQTQRQLEAIIPQNWHQQEANGRQEKKYALIIGKKRINFYKGSGISGTTCDKMYTESYVTLPGGFQLPVAIVTETWIDTDSQQLDMTEEMAQTLLRDFAKDYLPSQMIAGAILDGWEVCLPEDGLYRLEGKYACTEMISQTRIEENVLPNGNDQ